MAYNLERLIKLLDQVLHPDQHQRWILDPDKTPQIESLLENAVFLRDTLANYAGGVSEDSIDSLEDEIGDAVLRAEEFIERHIDDQVSTSRWSQRFTIILPGLQKVIEEFDSAKEETMKIMEGVRLLHGGTSAVSPRDPNTKKILVGFTEDLTQLKDRVTCWSSKLEIIPIVGMGGIGKTTLARNIYDDPSIVSHFDVCAWITISEDYRLRGILLGLLRCLIGEHTDGMLREKDDQLKLTLHQKLMGRRYLIVLDDMWHPKAWDDMKKFFPNEQNGSRIIVTTRESNVATYVDLKSSHHQMHLLNMDDSWKLLRSKVYGEETCPSELEKLGIKIANSCRGLPLSIPLIGGLLSHTTRTRESWEQVANNVSSGIADKDEQFSRILSLSYNRLPHHLRPCFLYVSAFPEDYEIRASKLIRLWVAEGFLRPIASKSQEEAAEVYLKALIDRNLISVVKQETNGKVKTCAIHDLLRDLSVGKARQKKFLCVNYKPNHDTSEDATYLHRVSVHTSYRIRDTHLSTKLISIARTFLCTGPTTQQILSHFSFNPLLMRVLDVLEIQFRKVPEEILRLVNLRYLACPCDHNFPRYIYMFKNLETLIVRSTGGTTLPLVTIDVFDMPRLRHLKCISGWQLCSISGWGRFKVQENLQSLSTTEVHNIQEVLRCAPNLKKLGIKCSSFADIMVRDLSCLHKLERLKCSTDLSPNAKTFLFDLIFPPFLINLSLSKCTILPTSMNAIGLLPNLEVLKLQKCTFEDPHWEPCEGEFNNLQYLLLENLNLVNWKGDQNNFPRLRHLIIRGCSAAEGISTDLGEIPTLELIEVDISSLNVVNSAMQILEEQRELGNDLLQVRISGVSRP